MHIKNNVCFFEKNYCICETNLSFSFLLCTIAHHHHDVDMNVDNVTFLKLKLNMTTYTYDMICYKTILYVMYFKNIFQPQYKL